MCTVIIYFIICQAPEEKDSWIVLLQNLTAGHLLIFLWQKEITFYYLITYHSKRDNQHGAGWTGLAQVCLMANSPRLLLTVLSPVRSILLQILQQTYVGTV